MLTTWILVLCLLKTDGTGTAPRFGPFASLDDCKQAGARWLTAQIGNTDVYAASWACKATRGAQ